MIVTQISIDLSGKYRYEYVVAKQGDADSRLIQVTLLSDSRIYVIDDQTTARVSITKPDKTEVIQDCTVNNNMVEILLDANMLAAAGTAVAEILLTDQAGTVTSASFDIKVVATKAGKNTESSNDYKTFKEALVALNEKYERIGEVEEQIKEVDEKKADLKEVATYITPEMYGAVGDGVTDDSAAIQQAIDAAGNTGVVYLSKKTYLIGSSLVFSHRPSIFRCDGTISYTGTGCAIIVARSQVNLDIAMIDAPNGTAVQVNSGNHGLSCGSHSISDCVIKVGLISNSVIGLHEFTDDKPQTYNRYYIDKVFSSQTCVFVENLGTDGNVTYINEHYYWLGALRGNATTGIKLIKCGSHKFFNGSFEGLDDNATALYLEDASFNVLRNFRCLENYGSTIIKFVGACTDNDIEYAQMHLQKVDISELGDIGNVFNILRSPSMTSVSGTKTARCGTIAHVNKKCGVNYDTRFDIDLYANVTDEMFENNVIRQMDNLILTSLRFNHAGLNGMTFTLGEVYSHYGSLAKGLPITMSFADDNSKILLNDANGDLVLDNREGIYCGKIVSARWVGFDQVTTQNIWDIQVLGESTGLLILKALEQDITFANKDFGVVLESDGGKTYRIVVKENGLLTTATIPTGNMVPLSIDTDGTIYNGCGYIDGYRINSSGANAAHECASATGYITVTDGDALEMQGFILDTVADAIAVYDKNYSFLGSFNGNGNSYGIFAGDFSAYALDSVTEKDGVYIWNVPTGANIAFVRISAYEYNSGKVCPGDSIWVAIDNGSSQTPIVESVNGKKGVVKLNAEDVGADAAGTAANVVNAHNTAEEAHGDIRLLIAGLKNRLNALADSDDTTLDQLSEIVAYIKSNKTLIDAITTSKVNVSDIIDNLTTSSADKPLSAKQGVALKKLIDAIVVPKKVSELENDKGYITGYIETDPTVPAWAKESTKPTYTASEVGAVPKTETLTMVGTDADGKTHTWTIYGKGAE